MFLDGMAVGGDAQVVRATFSWLQFLKSGRLLGHRLQPGATLPAQLKILRILFATCAAKHHTCFDWGFFKSAYNSLSPSKIAVVDNPHFGISVGKRDVSHPALRMFIE